jgi:AraC family L-rhamnose operon transcriptional activator RhaR
MSEPPVGVSDGLFYFTDGTLAYAGHYLHEATHPDHTHSFVEIVVVTGGEGVHRSLAGRQPLSVGDLLLLRPGVWHGYEDCRGLDVYNCCFSTELLRRELAWTQEDPGLGYLLWTGPHAANRRGLLTARLDRAELPECLEHLDALDRLRFAPAARYRADVIGRLVLLLSCLSRAVAGGPAERSSPAAAPTPAAVVQAMRLMQARPEQPWTLTELADRLHLAPGYLVRLFKSATGLPPMAYLSRFRVETAAAMLLNGDTPVSQVGLNVGWPDPSYFARRFKAHYGLSASAYRARFGPAVAHLHPWPGPGDPAEPDSSHNGSALAILPVEEHSRW